MPYVDNRFQNTNKSIKTIHPHKTEKYGYFIAKTNFSEVENIKDLQLKSHIKSVYKDICKKIDLNEKIRPDLEFDSLGAACGFSVTEGKIYFDDSVIKKLDNDDIIFIIRHELEHVKQFNNIERMLGLKNFKKLMSSKAANSQDKDFNIAYYKKVEQVLGKIDKNSPEGICTQKYIDAFKKYPDLLTLAERTDICKLKKIFLLAKEFIINYKFNFLETSANKAAKKFMKTFKV